LPCLPAGRLSLFPFFGETKKGKDRIERKRYLSTD